ELRCTLITFIRFNSEVLSLMICKVLQVSHLLATLCALVWPLTGVQMDEFLKNKVDQN
ncbi:hypothetical protein L9F63_027146, partial [Diploptera punctata]